MNNCFSQAKKFLAVGEIMLRLTPVNYGLLNDVKSLEGVYGGSEANMAVSLSSLGLEAGYFTVVPDHKIGRGALRYLESFGVDCSRAIKSTSDETPTNRLGTYYLEKGYGIRPSSVVYDRKHSAVTEYDYSKMDFDKLVEGYDWIHVSGITLALGDNCRELIMSCLKAAKRKGIIVSFDGNFRGTLWSWEKARQVCTECLPYVDVLFGIEPYNLYVDETDPDSSDVKDKLSKYPALEEHREVFEAFVKRYPNIKCISRHLRRAESDVENSLKAYVWYDGEVFESKTVQFHILDRVGGGDAFAAGFIYAVMQDYTIKEAADFAVAASAIKHTINGDANTISDPNVIKNVLNDYSDIKR